MKEMKRIISLLLCLVMLAGYLPVNARAEEAMTTEPSVVETAEETAAETTEETQPEKPGKPAGPKGPGKHEKPGKPEPVKPEAPKPEQETVPETTEATVPVTEETVPETTEATVPATEETVPETTEETEPVMMMMAAPRATAPEHVDAAIFFSDLHTSETNYKETTVKGIMDGLKNSSLKFSSVTSCGDAFSVNEDNTKYTGYTSTITSYIRSVFTGIPVNYVWSDHDRYAVQEDGKTLLDNDSGFIYGAGADGTYGTADDGNYYVYELSMADLSTNNRYKADFHSNEEVTATIAAFVADAAELDQTKPLFIASHQPLLDRRNDNGHALEWANAINTVAKTMDVAFFFGHNHKYDESSDYYYAKGSSMPVEGSSKPVELNFTHLCTGYMEPTSTGSYSSSGTRRGVAVAVTIFEDSISYVTYDKNGVYTGSYALDKTVTRDHAQAEDSGNSGGTTEIPGVTILDASGNAVEAAVAVNNEASVQDAVADLLTNAVAYDIDIEGDVGDIVITLPAAGIANPAVYYIPVDDTPVDMNAVKNDDGTVSFETNHNSTYAVGERAVSGDEGDTSTNRDPETATGDGNTTTKQEKEVYVLVNKVSAAGDYLFVNTNAATTDAHMLTAAANDVTDTGNVTVKTGTDASGKSIAYIESPAAAAIWTASGSNNNYKLYNAAVKRYLRRDANKLKVTDRSNDASNWNTSKDNAVYYDTNTDRYIRYNDGWSALNKNSGTVYIYQKQTVTLVTNTTVSGTYSIAGNPAEVTKVVTNGTTAELNAVLTFTPSDGGAATTTENPDNVNYTVVEGSDILSVSGNTVTFTGTIGEAVVKVSYTTSFGEVSNYITVIAAEPTYLLDITKDETVVTGTTLTKKGVTSTTTLQLGTKVQYMGENGTSPVDLPEGATIAWNIPEEYQTIATVDNNGLITFKGVDGAFYVTATLTVNGKSYTVGVNISATTSLYSVPSDHTSDFPEYPNEGAIRYDKTATAVGNFSQTGIAQLELSMTGVPYTTGSQLDVVLMLDHSNSMTEARMAATRAAVRVFVNNIVKNEDGSFNNNRIYIGSFAGGNPEYAGQSRHEFRIYRMTEKESSGYQIVNNQAELDALIANVNSTYVKFSNNAPYGTEYDQSLEDCYRVLSESKADGNQQFCVFMSDGIPNVYRYGAGKNDITTSSEAMAKLFTPNNGTKGTRYTSRGTNYKYEYWSSRMKSEGVTVFSVGLGLYGTNSSLSGANEAECERVSNMLLNDIAGPAGETAADRDTGNAVSKLGTYFYSVADANAAQKMQDVFAGIAAKILQAATDVTVEDKITDEYTMIFDIPEGTEDITGVSNDFYIEFGKYALNEDHERTTYTSNTKLYIQNTNGVLSAKDSTAPVFQKKTIGDKGTLYYWSTNASDGDAGVSVTVGSTTYYFVSYGMETAGYNMTSGAYANGTVDATTNMSNDLVIATPYFVYNAATKMLYWTVDKLDTEECVLRYFLYLNNSATEVGNDGVEVPAGSYLTNDHAYISYTNFNGNDCRQEFPKPQLTWNGAQVSYVFYLVNAAGQPINKSGQVVDFANATFVTDVYTDSVVWNKEGNTSTGTGRLSADWLAHELLPDEYEIYDEQARYILNVYEDATGSNKKNEFTISGGTATEIATSLKSRLKLENVTASVTTTKVYNTKAGMKVTGYNTYYSTDADMKDIDFANTTVAFAVVWQPRLVPDAVVVDYGLDVLINVTQNDILQNKVSGIGEREPKYINDIAMNSGVSTEHKLGTAALNMDGNTISIENENAIRFHQGDMQFKDPVVFYYETPVEFWEGSDPTEGFMYSSVTVIPATTIYYEDEFLTLSTLDKDGNPTANAWVASTPSTATQAQDRPGKSQISAALDADNNYGYDAAYENMSTYSMSNAAKITVDSEIRGEATFTFYGTGFDVIGLTSNKTGTLIVQIFEGAEVTGDALNSSVVDTYYGYTKNTNGEWVITNDADNALYQVPVMKHFGLDYGQYTVKLVAGYNDYFNHTAADGSYDLYLDAVRIYDPANNGADNQVVEDAYKADGEGWPTYFEVRNEIIDANTFESVGTDPVNGIVFIDGVRNNASVSDYTSYGPNNETYLAAGQAIAFDLSATATKGKVAKVQLAVKTVGDSASIKVYSTDGVTALDKEINTATDMYYDITDLNEKTVVIMNDGEEGILSITNVKVTYTEEQPAPENTAGVFMLRRTSVETVLASLNEEEEVPETTVPETTVPETTEPEETKPAKPNNSELKASVEEAKKLKSKDYTKASFKKLETAIKAAEKVLKDKKATQAQIDKALADLNAALETLETVPNNSELKAAVEAAKKLKQKGYTQASFKKLQTAIKDAEKVLKDKKATQAQIDKALEDLNAAVDGLETVAVNPIKPKPGGSNGKIKNNFKAMDSIADVFRNLLKGNKK